MTNKILDVRARPDEPSDMARTALNGARLALAQLAVDAQTLLDAWQERVSILEVAEATTTSAIAKGDCRAAREEIARCRKELQGLLDLWKVD